MAISNTMGPVLSSLLHLHILIHSREQHSRFQRRTDQDKMWKRNVPKNRTKAESAMPILKSFKTLKYKIGNTWGGWLVLLLLVSLLGWW